MLANRTNTTGTRLHSHILCGNGKRKVQDSDSALLDNKSTDKLDKEHRRIYKKKKKASDSKQIFLFEFSNECTFTAFHPFWAHFP